MFEFLSKPSQLERRGLSSGKRRLKVKEGDLVDALEEGNATKAALFVIFTLAVTLLVQFGRDQGAIFASSMSPGANILQSALVVNVIIISMVIQFYVNHESSFAQNGRVVLILGVMLAHLFLLQVAFIPAQSEFIEDHYQFLIPAYGLAPMAMSILLGRNHGTFAAIYVSLLGALLVQAEKAFPFFVLSLVSGFVAVFFTHQIRRRSTVVTAGFYVGIATTIVAIATGQIPIQFAEWQSMLYQVLTTILAGVITAMLVSGILPLVESIFRITTDITWIELADLNHPVLKRLSYEAPGTYHHSQVVARLAEAAAESIGANGTMSRVCSYFHDIGKLNKPQYFIENVNPEENPHDELTPTMSALIITAHVKDGVDLALKHKLNKEIISVIREHHGTSLVQYFYHRAMEQRKQFEAKVEQGKANVDDVPVVEEKGFRYPGPKPRSRESAIISLADSIESASRSIAKPTPPKIDQLIQEIVESRLQDGQLDDCGLTLADLKTVKASFHTSLCGMMHSRVAYPKDESDKSGSEKGKKEKAEPKLEVVKEQQQNEAAKKAKPNVA